MALRQSRSGIILFRSIQRPLQVFRPHRISVGCKSIWSPTDESQYLRNFWGWRIQSRSFCTDKIEWLCLFPGLVYFHYQLKPGFHYTIWLTIRKWKQSQYKICSNLCLGTAPRNRTKESLSQIRTGKGNSSKRILTPKTMVFLEWRCRPNCALPILFLIRILSG